MIRVRIVHEANQKDDRFKDKFSHRLLAFNEDGSLRTAGESVSYTGVALITVGDRSFFAVTAYYDGTFPIEQVIEYTIPRGVRFQVEIDQ